MGLICPVLWVFDKPALTTRREGAKNVVMKILVPVKRVIDPYAKIRVKADGSGVEMANMKMAMNPFDEIAVEEALRLREKNVATEVVAMAVGAANVVDTLRQAQALGANRAIHVAYEGEVQPLAYARLLKAVVEREQPRLVIMGKQAIDDDYNQTGQMLAALLDWPQATFASKVDVAGDVATVVREIDGGLQTISVTLPAVITTDLRLNNPRYASLPNIMKAKKLPIDTLDVAALGVEMSPRMITLTTTEPEARKPGVMVKDVDELIGKLKNDARVI